MSVAAPEAAAPIPAPANPLEAVLARNRERADYSNVTGEAPAAPKPKTVEIAADDAVVRRVTKLESEAIAHKATIAKLETTAKQAETLLRVQELYKAGKRSEALGLLSEADPSEEMEKLLEEHLSKQTEETEGALAERVDALQKKVDADAKARADAEAARAAAEAKRAEDEAQASTMAFATHALDTAVNDDGTLKFELCSRLANREGAAKLAIEHAVALAVKKGMDVESLTPDATRALLQEAYADVEVEIEAEGVAEQKRIDERYKRAPKVQPRAQQPTAQSVGLPNPGTERGQQPGQQTTRPQPTPRVGLVIEKPKPAYSLEAVLAKNRERARY